MASTQKAIAWRDEVAADLKVLLPSLAQTKGFDTDGAPTLLVGAAAGGSDGFFLKITPVASIQKDVLGLAQNVFTPHIFQLAFEADYAATTDNVANVVTQPTQMAALGCAITRGAKVEWYEETTGTAPSASTITGTKLKATWVGTRQYPLMADL